MERFVLLLLGLFLLESGGWSGVVGNNNKEYRIGPLMVHTLGSGTLNIPYYFHILGVACENRDRGLWNNIQTVHKKCEASVGSQEPKIVSGLPSGSFLKECGGWVMGRECKGQLAHDLDLCLGNQDGGDAFQFIDSYMKFTCRNIDDTQAQITIRVGRRMEISPGPFRCFPELQDRISNCVKRDPPRGGSFCSELERVEECFGKYYTDFTCNDPSAIEHMRDLFITLGRDLRCTEGRNDLLGQLHPDHPLLRGPPVSLRPTTTPLYDYYNYEKGDGQIQGPLDQYDLHAPAQLRYSGGGQYPQDRPRSKPLSEDDYVYDLYRPAVVAPPNRNGLRRHERRKTPRISDSPCGRTERAAGIDLNVFRGQTQRNDPCSDYYTEDISNVNFYHFVPKESFYGDAATTRTVSRSLPNIMARVEPSNWTFLAEGAEGSTTPTILPRPLSPTTTTTPRLKRPKVDANSEVNSPTTPPPEVIFSPPPPRPNNVKKRIKTSPRPPNVKVIYVTNRGDLGIINPTTPPPKKDAQPKKKSRPSIFEIHEIGSTTSPSAPTTGKSRSRTKSVVARHTASPSPKRSSGVETARWSFQTLPKTLANATRSLETASRPTSYGGIVYPTRRQPKTAQSI